MPTPRSPDVPVEVYVVAVEEYRFQTRLNWDRCQSMLVFDAGLLAAGIGLGRVAGVFAAAVFFVGLVASVAAFAAVGVQHTYYRAARDRMVAVEAVVLAGTGVPVMDTTPGMVGGGFRWARVVNVVRVMLVALFLAHAACLAALTCLGH
jgi:hypothetical protein